MSEKPPQNVSEEGRAKRAEAGRENLKKYWRENPSGPSLRHGAKSRHVRARYSDKRTAEGKRLAAIVRELRAELGPDISAGQALMLDQIKARLVVILQISKYADAQPSLVSPSGELLPALGRNFTTYAEGLRRDLLALYEMSARRPSKVPDLSTYLKQKAEEKKRAGDGGSRKREAKPEPGEVHGEGESG